MHFQKLIEYKYKMYVWFYKKINGKGKLIHLKCLNTYCQQYTLQLYILIITLKKKTKLSVILFLNFF